MAQRESFRIEGVVWEMIAQMKVCLLMRLLCFKIPAPQFSLALAEMLLLPRCTGHPDLFQSSCNSEGEKQQKQTTLSKRIDPDCMLMSP